MAERDFFTLRYALPGYTFILIFILITYPELYEIFTNYDITSVNLVLSAFLAFVTLLSGGAIGFLVSQFWYCLHNTVLQRYFLRDTRSFLKEEFGLTDKTHYQVVFLDHIFHLSDEKAQDYVQRRFDLQYTLASTIFAILIGSLVGVLSKNYFFPVDLSLEGKIALQYNVPLIILFIIILLFVLVLGFIFLSKEHSMMVDIAVKNILDKQDFSLNIAKKIFSEDYFEKNKKCSSSCKKVRVDSSTSDPQENSQNKKLTKLYLFLFIFGVLLSLSTVLILPIPTDVSQTESFNERGFVFKSSENLTSSESQFIIAFNDIDLENAKANCTVIVNPYISNTSEYNSAYFLLQIPFKINNLDVNYLAGQPIAFGGNNSTISYNNITCIYIDIPKERVKFNWRGNSITYNFIIESGFTQLNQYTYEFPITWSGSLNNAFEDMDYSQEKVDFYNELYFFDVNRAFLNVERSAKYYYSNFLPNSNRIGVWRGTSSYYWDLKPISGTGGESTIILELTNLFTKSQIDLRYSIVWLLLGIAIPTTITSLIEIVKSRDKLLI